MLIQTTDNHVRSCSKWMCLIFSLPHKPLTTNRNHFWNKCFSWITSWCFFFFAFLYLFFLFGVWYYSLKHAGSGWHRRWLFKYMSKKQKETLNESVFSVRPPGDFCIVRQKNRPFATTPTIFTFHRVWFQLWCSCYMHLSHALTNPETNSSNVAKQLCKYWIWNQTFGITCWEMSLIY